jgi:hypothetical protein
LDAVRQWNSSEITNRVVQTLAAPKCAAARGWCVRVSSSFRLQPLRAAIVVAIPAVPAFAAVDSASEFGISTYGRFRARRYFRPFKGRVLALGPLVGKTVDLWKLPFTFTVKYDVEFAAQNRSTGNEVWLTGGFRF